MINDVDSSLSELVKRDVLAGANVEVSFEAPKRDWAAKRNGPTLNLYLYDIHEDLDRRFVQYRERRDENGIVVARRPRPRLFRLAYLVTAWTQRPEDEHRLLSAVLQAFLRSDTFPKEHLRGSLAQLEEPIRTTCGLPLPKDRSISDVWTALGGELKPSLDLIVTVPFEYGTEVAAGPPVLEEPKITMSAPGAEPEERQLTRRNDVPSAEPVPAVAEETLQAGKSQQGRNFRIRELPQR